MDNILLFNTIEKHLLEDAKPSEFLEKLIEKDEFYEYPFKMLSDLKSVMQNEKFHPEGSVWNHTKLVVDEAAGMRDKSRNPRVFMWASLLHDIGKAPTTKVRNGRITSYNHEKIGSKMAQEFLGVFQLDDEFINNVAALVRWHMEPLFWTKNLPFSNMKGMLSQVSLNEIALLSLCDRFGRGDMSEDKRKDEKKGVEIFIDKCEKMLRD